MGLILWQVSRIGMLWLFLAVLATVLPLLMHLPVWVIAIPLFCLLWRVGIYRGLWGSPGKIVRLLLVFAAVAAVGFSFSRLYGLEPMAAMLVSAYGLKLLEIRQRRDALVVIYLGYFVAAIYALFDQSLVAGAYLLLAFCLVTASLAGIHQTEMVKGSGRPLVKALVITAQAIPLMVIFFLVMPRLGPFWSVPSPTTAVTGVKDHLSIGDIVQLGTSSKTAFRVTFEGEIPPREALYWRGLTFSAFDGKTWKPVSWGFKDGIVRWYGENPAWWRQDLQFNGTPFTYEVILEPQNGQWLFSLLGSQTVSPDTGMTRMQTPLSMYPVTRKLQYRVQTWPSAKFQAEDLTVSRKQIELALPDGVNPRTRAMAEQWVRETPDAEQLIARVLEFYGQNFAYTLQPPALGEQAIDDFLFVSRQGFCEHFASSFVFFMRAAGIPSRIVVGYQGGEIHPEEGYLTVRQYDAHAWAEVWIADRGWIRVDPTAAVAPDRIAMGIISLLTAPVVLAESTVTLDKYRDIPWLNQLRLYLDSVDYAWGRWVLGYQTLQSDFLRGLMGGMDFKRAILFVLAGSLLGLLPAMVFSLWPRGRRTINLLDRYYLAFCRKTARHGCVRATGETPRHFADRCVQLFPAQRHNIEAITAYYEQARYSGSKADPAVLKRLVRSFKP